MGITDERGYGRKSRPVQAPEHRRILQDRTPEAATKIPNTRIHVHRMHIRSSIGHGFDFCFTVVLPK